MTEPYRPGPAPGERPPWWPADRPWPPQLNADQCQVIAHMVNLSAEIVELEELLGRDNALSSKELKRLDKAVTVAKVALKIMKKAMRASRKTGRPLVDRALDTKQGGANG